MAGVEGDKPYHEFQVLQGMNAYGLLHVFLPRMTSPRQDSRLRQTLHSVELRFQNAHGTGLGSD